MLTRLLFATTALVLVGNPVRAESPDFARDVRPILSDHCFACHGPDQEQRKAGLRLDTSEGYDWIVEPGEPEASELYLRVMSDDPGMVMPPPKFHKPLSDKQKKVLSEWIASGAEVSRHWAFEPPVKMTPPDNGGSTAIDQFLLERINRSELETSPRADRRTLIRRVCLDLTGLPPTREQIDRFLADTSPDAYESLVDRLLHSPRYGEHMGRYWLDLVRYADTHGLHLDNYREMWPYRDWVIDAFNDNMPFDQFITEQLAGDLLPGSTDSQKVASGFNRLNVTTNEGGSIYKEVFTRNVMDRTDSFGTVFLGLTTGCAACHDHKFDPLTMRDYYSLFAFFNGLDGSAMDQNIKDPPPVLAVPTDQQEKQLAATSEALRSVRDEMQGDIPSVDRAQRRWEASLLSERSADAVTLDPLEAKSEAGKALKVRDDGAVALEEDAAPKDTVTVVAPLPQDSAWKTLRLEALVPDPESRVGASPNGNAVLSEITLETSAGDGDWVPVAIAQGFADVEQTGGDYALSYAYDGKVNDSQGWAVAGHEQLGPRNAWFVMPAIVAESPDAKVRVRLEFQSKYAAHQFRTVRLSLSDSAPTVPEDQRIARGPIHTVGPFPTENPAAGYGRKFASQQAEFKADETFRYQNRTLAWQHRGDVAEVKVCELPAAQDQPSAVLLHQSLESPSDQKVKLLIGSEDGHVVYLNGKQIGQRRGVGDAFEPLAEEYELSLKTGNNRLYIKVVNHGGPSRLSYAFRSPALGLPERLASLVKIPRPERDPADAEAIRRYYRQVYCLHPDWLALVDQEKGLVKARQSLRESFPTTLVWKETEEPRQAHLLKRGQYDQPGEEVSRATPAFLPPLPENAPANRLGLARWLVSDRHPLTARVAVNRFWQQLFGSGIVKTSEDFGSQGGAPSHPGLLDWLAVDFRESGWDVRRLMKLLVMSDAYRRSAAASERARQIDPTNRLLARGPRYRIDAEVLRDQALELSGLLVHKLGGPSVKPPQPQGLWHAVGYTRSNTANFTADSGEKVYRRSVYTFWKRTSAPPQMSTFDAPSRESCTARRERTNTPLQALVMLNETQYVEASRQLARRTLEHFGEAGSDTAEDARAKVRWLFETVTIRPPTDKETDELVRMLGDLITFYEANPKDAAELVGDSSANRAAWTVLASTLLNLDEVINK